MAVGTTENNENASPGSLTESGKGVFLNAVELPESAFSDAVTRRILRYQFVYAVIGLALGFTTTVSGLVLFALGLTGRTSLIASLLGARIQVTDAAPGAVIATLGLLLVAFTRFDVKVAYARSVVQHGRIRLPKAS